MALEERVLLILGLRKRRLLPPRRLAHMVDRDAMRNRAEPRRQLRTAFEERQRPECAEKRLLRQVFHRAGVARRTPDHGSDDAAVKTDEFGARCLIAGKAPRDELPVVMLHAGW